MIRHLALATSLAALLASGAAQAARDACQQAADIVRAAYPRAPSADNEGNIRLGQDNIVLRIADADYGEPFAVTCKTWPAKPDLLLAAIPLMQDTPNQDDGHQGDLRILVLDRATLKIRHDLRLEGVMSDDAVRLSDVSFDTARYDVTAGRRAFGLRISRVGASRANPFGETSLRLFDIGPKGLAMVLDGLIVHRSGGEWDTNCAGSSPAAPSPCPWPTRSPTNTATSSRANRTSRAARPWCAAIARKRSSTKARRRAR